MKKFMLSAAEGFQNDLFRPLPPDSVATAGSVRIEGSRMRTQAILVSLQQNTEITNHDGEASLYWQQLHGELVK